MVALVVTIIYGPAALQHSREMALRQEYYAKISLAQDRINELAFDQAHELLESCPIELRNWEWGRLSLLCHPALMTLKGHSAYVTCVAFSPDGKRLVSGCCNNTIKVWDAGDGRVLMTLKGHTSWVVSVAFSPDGKRIASGSYDNTIKIWDVGDGRELLTLKGHTHWVKSVAFSPDGRQIASSAQDGTIIIFPAADWKTPEGSKQ